MNLHTSRPRLSIVVVNRRRERFVAHAIESALAQTLRHDTPEALEILIVDAGSRDGSLAAIRRHAPQLPLIALDDDSEAAAMNAGFAAARGELIVFLESEDWLHPEAAAEVLAAWRPGVSKVQFRLDLVDADDRPLGRLLPRDLHGGAQALALLREFGAYGSPPCSGNAFHRDYLARVLPLDEAPWHDGADTVPILLAPACGEVRSIPVALGACRSGGEDELLAVGTTARSPTPAGASTRASRRCRRRWSAWASRTAARRGWRRGRLARWCWGCASAAHRPGCRGGAPSCACCARCCAGRAWRRRGGC